MPGVCSASHRPKGRGHPVLRPRPPRHGRTPAPRAAANACTQPGSAWSRLPPSWGQWGSRGLPLCPLFSQHGAQLSPFPSWGAHGAMWAPATPCLRMLLPQTSAELPLPLGDRSDSQFGWEDALLRRTGGSEGLSALGLTAGPCCPGGWTPSRGISPSGSYQ